MNPFINMNADLKETMENAKKEASRLISNEPMNFCGRESAKSYLETVVNRHHKMCHQLCVLRDMLPTKLTPEQDDALYFILSQKDI